MPIKIQAEDKISNKLYIRYSTKAVELLKIVTFYSWFEFCFLYGNIYELYMPSSHLELIYKAFVV